MLQVPELGVHEQSEDLSSTTTNEQGVLPRAITKSFVSPDRAAKKEKTEAGREDQRLARY